MRKLRPCALPGCPSLVEKGYCQRHDKYNKKEVNRHAFERLDKKKDPKAIAFYNSAAWKKVSKVYRKYHPLCELCEETDPLHAPIAKLVHHKKPLHEIWHNKENPLSFRFLQALCKSCHNRIHLRPKKN